ncbi:MazG nucleotide pyrophosphohydrolase domain-containing protein [Enterococcus sp. HY326]|uniref:MazG nucleotide pyrophosphohydrolase domain-containing protein n=1 Tax=Enterococcus sp. HY326 TaxID=2971265 RepID=UPI0022400E1C|nr:MazG nucleotide pyrophosphohydrolase domain-containing protein [Enterococcus sp. HY326]
MKELTVKQLEDYLALKYKDTGITESLFMKLVEEIGEVAEVLNQIQGRKKKPLDNSLANELVDVIHYTFAIAALNNIDLEKAIIEKDKDGSRRYNQPPNLSEFLSDNLA